MNIVEIAFHCGGLGIVFDDGTSANGRFEIRGGVLYMTGLSTDQKAALALFNSNIDSSVLAYDPRFGNGSSTGIFNVVEDLSPQLGNHLDLNGFNIYDDSGDSRGLHAFDFQLSKINSSEVASGNYSFIAGGRNNTASGDGSYAEGDANTSSGRYSHTEGSNNVASGNISHAEGYNNTASGNQSHAEGENNTASGDQSHAEGYRTIASGIASHSEGSFATASGHATFAGNYDTLASGEASRATGISSASTLYAQRAHAAGTFTKHGDAQNTETLARITTIDDNWTELYLDGDAGTQQFIISENSFYSIRVMIGGLLEGTNLGCMFIRMLTVERMSGDVNILGEEIIGTDINPGRGTLEYFSVRFKAIDDRLSIQTRYDDSKGPKNVRWLAHIDALEISNPDLSPGISPSMSPSMSHSLSPSISHSPSASSSNSISPSISISPSPSISISPSPSISQFSTSISISPSTSLSPSASPSISPSISPTVPPGGPAPVVRTYSTIKSIGVEWDIVDADHDATCAVQYKVTGEPTWVNAMPLFRVDHDSSDPAGTHFDMLAGSILFLEPGTSYDVNLDAVDPDSGTTNYQFTISTRPVPVLPTGGNTYHVIPGTSGGDGSSGNPFQGIATAQAAAQPKDIFLLHVGTYQGSGGTRVDFSVPGTPGNYIVWKIADDGDVIFDTGINISADHIWLEEFNIEGPVSGTGITTDNAPYDIVISRNNITLSHYGIWIGNDGGSYWYIADNTIVGDVLPGSGDFGGEGVELNHTDGHTVCYNTISYTADGVSYPNINVDIFGNDIFNVSDDGVEPDYGYANIRVWGNRITNANNNGLSFQPMNSGPWYMLRNQVIVNEGGALKLRIIQANALIAHNTFVCQGLRMAPTAHALVNVHANNNIWILVNETIGGRIWEGPSVGVINYRTNLDYDGFDQNVSTYIHKWNGIKYTTLASFNAATGLQGNGINLDRTTDLESFSVPATGMVDTNLFLTLSASSDAIDAGVVLPNINDGYNGSAPDLGAYEYGDPDPQYGVRPI